MRALPPASLALLVPPAQAPGEVDWVALGLALAIAGSFLLAAAILFHSPRDLIEERLGRGRRGLARVREPIFQRVQLGLGFAFLLAGFGLQLAGRGGGEEGGAGVPSFWIGVVLLAALGLSALGWWWSNVALRRHLRAFLREHPPELEAELGFARELGELYGVRPRQDDSVQSFLGRLRAELGLGPRASAPPAPEPTLEASLDEAELGEGAARALFESRAPVPRNRR